jgi:hypothetical protein
MKLLTKVAAYCGVALTVLTAAAPASAALLPQSWNGYHWAHTGNLAIMIGNNTSANWAPYLTAAAAAWSADKYIDYIPTAGTTTGSACAPMYGTVQVCSGNYGATNWLGWTTVWTTGTNIYQATIKLNDYYFSWKKYNTVASHQQVICQEMGNALGLQDSDRNYTNLNLGSCMDYSNDPSGTKGTNGTLANTGISASDFSHLDAIYGVLDTTQLIYTKPGVFTNPQSVGGGVPEPSSWAMIVCGFGALGMAMRRRKQVPAVAFAN